MTNYHLVIKKKKNWFWYHWHYCLDWLRLID